MMTELRLRRSWRNEVEEAMELNIRECRNRTQEIVGICYRDRYNRMLSIE